MIPISFMYLDEDDLVVHTSQIFNAWVTKCYSKYNFFEDLFRKSITKIFYKNIEDKHVSKGKYTVMCIKNFRIYVKFYRSGNVIYIDNEASKSMDTDFIAYSIKTPVFNTVELINFISTTKNQKQKEEYFNIIKKNNFLLVKTANDISDISRYITKGIIVTNEKNDLYECINYSKNNTKEPNSVIISKNSESCNTIIDKSRFTDLLYYIINFCLFYAKSDVKITYDTSNILFYFKKDKISKIHEDILLNETIHKYDYVNGIDLNIARILSLLLKIDIFLKEECIQLSFSGV